jgi:putative salt-induced outer membrane protein YdiY
MSFTLPLRFWRTILAASLVALAVAPLLRADTVVLKNGDRLSGTVVKLDGGKLTLKTAYADAVVIAWDQVESFTTSTAMVLPTPKGNLSVTGIERATAGIVVTTPSGPSTLDPVTVTVLRSPADQQAYEASLHPSWGHAWAGAANASLALTRGNSSTATFGAGFTAARTTSTDKTSLYADTIYATNANSTPTTSANSTGGGISYDHNLNPKTFAFVSGDFLANALQDLDLRSIIGGGIGWHAVKTPKQTFDVLGGIVYTHESYSATAVVPASTTNNFPALDLGEQYTRKIGAASLFTEQLNVYPDLSSLGQVQLTFNSGFSTKIGKMFNWVTSFGDNYTSFPPAGTLKNDIVLTTGLGVTLARP